MHEDARAGPRRNVQRAVRNLLHTGPFQFEERQKRGGTRCAAPDREGNRYYQEDLSLILVINNLTKY